MGASPRATLRSDHPRACGEHTTRPLQLRQSTGSSPRLRGTPIPLAPQPALVRIIPAPAGNTRTMGRPFRPHRDHPRACGEHDALKMQMRCAIGSSPRLRGTRHERGHALPRERIIPAPAGNTSLIPALIPYTSDHPRACGEHITMRVIRGKLIGSSPRLRGTHKLTVL